MGGLLSFFAKQTITYVYDGKKKEIPFTTSVGSTTMTEDEYQAYMNARDAHMRRWSRMYSDSFLETEYRYEPEYVTNFRREKG